jgi:hypothetical protein
LIRPSSSRVRWTVTLSPVEIVSGGEWVVVGPGSDADGDH